MKSVLLVGQSNMAGRGYISETKPIINERIWMLRNGRWQMMAEPIHFDRAVSGVGPAASFAEKWCIDNPKEQIGLIPCAEGGSSIDEWRIDGTLFRHAVSEAKFALENSELIAILWHQGENDSSAGKYKEYYNISYQYISTVMKRIEERFTPEELAYIVKVMDIIETELMPEIDLKK